jgi:hypothetical protein
MVQVMLQPRRDHGTTGASGNGVIDDVVFLHRAVPGTCRLATLTPRVLTYSPTCTSSDSYLGMRTYTPYLSV